MWRCFFVTHWFPRVYHLLFVACARSSPLLRGVRLDGRLGVDWDFFVTGERWACGDVFLSRIGFRAFIVCFLWRARAAPAKRECVLMDGWIVDWDFFVSGERWACGDVFLSRIGFRAFIVCFL